MPDSVGHRTDHVDPWNEGLSPRAARERLRQKAWGRPVWGVTMTAPAGHLSSCALTQAVGQSRGCDDSRHGLVIGLGRRVGRVVCRHVSTSDPVPAGRSCGRSTTNIARGAAARSFAVQRSMHDAACAVTTVRQPLPEGCDDQGFVRSAASGCITVPCAVGTSEISVEELKARAPTSEQQHDGNRPRTFGPGYRSSPNAGVCGVHWWPASR